MNKRTFAGLLSTGVLLLAIVGGNSNSSQQQNELNKPKNVNSTQSKTTEAKAAPKAKPICDGASITTNCTFDGVGYSKYVYHPAVPEKSHTETVTTYQKKVVGYCTLCNDGTYSPSCATGRGACSWHDGVAQWSAPQYSNVPIYSTKTVIDTPAQPAYTETLVAP